MNPPNESKFELLKPEHQSFLTSFLDNNRMSQQQQIKLLNMSIDLQSWQEPNLKELLPEVLSSAKIPQKGSKVYSNFIVNSLEKKFLKIQRKEKDYTNFKTTKTKEAPLKFSSISSEDKVLGNCPVASERTRCCNLQTLDLVRSCGFDCSYCSIQSFFNDDTIDIEHNLEEKLKTITIDPTKRYHIGTGQASDSLMWGNRDGILDALFNFARQHPNVVLELKTKSHNISYLLHHDLPQNIIVTWSLNPQKIIDVEEKKTSSLQKRLDAAKKIADKGVSVGFHFHPMIYCSQWQDEYKKIADYLLKNFTPKQVALISMGTVTFTKKVINKIRSRGLDSKILQMELVAAEGKLSYPLDIKEELFKTLYQYLQPWHKEVFFYLCMEDKTLWDKCFNHSYESNADLEQSMINAYFDHVNS